MDDQDNIRNMSVIAHVDHGKSTLSDSLVSKAGIIAADKSGDARYMDTRKDEQERGITIKSTGVSLYYEYDNFGQDEEKKYLINLIDSPGHVDFSSEVTAALRVTDGALVVVDYVEGVAVQTETVLRQALQELIRPVVMINKVDRAFFELNHDAETIYQNFVRVIENANVIIDTYQNEDVTGSMQVHPNEGRVAFGSALHGWGFTLTTFAFMYGKKMKIEPSKMIKKLWGDNFFNPALKKWTKQEMYNDLQLQRGFCYMVIDPIKKLANAILEGNKDGKKGPDGKEIPGYLKMVDNLNIKMTTDEYDKYQGKYLVRRIMQKWINAAEALLELIITKLPSPREAQAYRTSILYLGSQDDVCAGAMKKCDPKGPLMMFISKMIPTPDGSRFYAFGRVFSGTVEASKKVRIMGPNYEPGKKDDLFEKNVQKVVLMMGRKAEEVQSVPCGNTCALVGVDSCLVKQGTISDNGQANLIKAMKYSVSPVVRVAVSPKNPADLPKMVDGLKKMAKSDPLVQVIQNENENIIAGSGELHLEICLKDLREEYAGVEIVVSDPVVPYKETVTEESDTVCYSKSANKHNKLHSKAEPIDEDLAVEIEDGKVGPNLEPKALSRHLIDEYDWDQGDAKKIWKFGPDNIGPNMLVDQTKAVQYLTEIKDSLENAFQWSARAGVLAEEGLRGVRFNILDVELHADAIHRGGGQIIPTARRNYYACELTAVPKFQEPIFNVDIAAPQDVLGAIYNCMAQRRGVVYFEENVTGTPLLNLKAYLPVAESFGFTESLRSHTHGTAFPQCVFDHWENVSSDPLDAGSQANKILLEIRKRKSLKEAIPSLGDYMDKH